MNPAERVLIGLFLVGSVLAFAKYVASTAKSRAARRRQRLGAANEADELAQAIGEVCVICQHPVKPEDDIFDQNTNSWWHRACWRASVK